MKAMRTPTDAVALMCTRNEGNENTDGCGRSDSKRKQRQARGAGVPVVGDGVERESEGLRKGL